MEDEMTEPATDGIDMRVPPTDDPALPPRAAPNMWPECSLCSKTFASYSVLRRHVKNMHVDADVDELYPPRGKKHEARNKVKIVSIGY